MLARVLLMIAIATSVAYAQPAPADPPPPPAEPPLDPTPPPTPAAGEASLEAKLEQEVDRWFGQGATAQIGARVGDAVRRARRSVSIGPTVGAFAGYFPDAEQSDYAITFGIGVELFKVPVLPTPERLKQLALERAKKRLKEQPQQIGDVEALTKQVWDDVLAEVGEMENYRARTLEPPKLSIALEGNRLFDSEVWFVRLRGGVGISKITLAASLSAAFTDPDTSFYAGAEVVLHAMMSKNPRSSVVDIFARGDFELANRDVANTDFFVLGVRYLLDVL